MTDSVPNPSVDTTVDAGAASAGSGPAMPATGDALRLSDVVAAMTYALDITEGQPEGHAMRTCLIGMGVGRELGLDDGALGDLYYALLLKDLGCSTNAARIRHAFGADDLRVKRSVKVVDFDDLRQGTRFVLENAGTGSPPLQRLKHILDVSLGRYGGRAALVEVRCERGADIARQMGFSERTAQAIRALDERWDGRGHPYGVEGEAIPLLGRILGLAQTAEVFFSTHGPARALDMARERSGRWFDPVLVEALVRAAARDGFWEALEDRGLEARVAGLEPASLRLRLSDERLDTVAEAFARVIDAKSPWTYRHSERVRSLALGAADHLASGEALTPRQRTRLRRAALLHDIGKLGVSNLILDKPGRLSEAEFEEIRMHPAHSERILERVAPFRALAPIAGAHHERLDGGGYPNGRADADLGIEVRLLAVADQFEALTASRPYRDGLAPEQALELIGRDVGEGVDPFALAALQAFLATPEGAPLLEPQAPDPEVPIPPAG